MAAARKQLAFYGSTPAYRPTLDCHGWGDLHLEVALERAQGLVLVRVRDHGPGLSKAERRRLFRPFSKSDRDAANSAPGVGLGLALSRQLARAQGGDLRLEGEAGGGACFILSLPCETGQTPA